MQFDKCHVCGIDMPKDPLHLVLGSYQAPRHVYCCRKHRYVQVEVGDQVMWQERSDLEIESLAFKFRAGELPVGWE